MVPDTDSAALTLGKVLKALRTERELSLEDIHLRTRISIKKLAWIEDDNFVDFEAPVFVRGYIRSYARVVGGDGDNLIALYDAVIQPATKAPAVKENASLAHSVGANPSWQLRIAKALSQFFTRISVWALVGVLVAIWLLTMLFSGSEVTEPESASQTAMSASSPAAASPVIEKDSTEAFAYETEGEPEAVLTDEAAAERADIVPEKYLPSQTQENDVLHDRGSAVFAPSATNTATEVSQSADAGLRLLEFQFSDDCWVEVRDGANAVLFADLKHKGDNLRLFGLPPLTVMLGNARAADLKVDGEAMDIQVSGARKTLRFSVLADTDP